MIQEHTTHSDSPPACTLNSHVRAGGGAQGGAPPLPSVRSQSMILNVS
jgi:hypothetical protein